ncbi:Na+/H+ antiporter subunit E [Modestobacter sp. NPDC049651]|uniref:Na+/H+ antiporter subunit E n=1 Tax=unclassified Modestobacter TaxID=2643866 RepID=UPI0033E03816
MSAGARARAALPRIAWPVAIWMLLWGTWSWANLLSGLLVALLVMTVLPLPPVVGGTRVRPLAAQRFLGHFVTDLVGSAAQVAWVAVRPGGPPRGAILRVRLRTDSDLLQTMVAEATALVPGSLVIDLDRERSTLWVHLLHVRDEDDLARQRAAVLTTEERLVDAFGSAEDRAALRTEGSRA